MKKRIIITLIVTTILSGCDALMQVATTVIESPAPLTSIEVANGLKEALKVSTDTAVVNLNKTNGYYLDEAIKIKLPPQTDEIIQYANKVPGISHLLESLVGKINHSAEDAAAQATPIFREAIKGITIEDAWGILRGNDNAATKYLQSNTNQKLYDLYFPVMQQSLNKELLDDVSANSTWNKLTGKWNEFASSFAGKLIGVKTVDVKLDEYATQQALDGLFIKVADQEKIIRKDVDARVNGLLLRVFSELDQQ